MSNQPSIGAQASGTAHRRSVALRVAVAGSALAGGLALVLVTGPLRPEVYVSAGIAVFISVAVYLVQPQAGTIAFLALGTAICVACAVALFSVGTVPWLLASFWGGAATLLAGLLDLIGKDGNESMVSVTVAAVVSLLLLSALGLGQYVRVSWPPASRAILESLPRDVTEQVGRRPGASGMVVEQAPGGRWVGRWVVRTRDAFRTWDSLTLAIEADGWRVVENEQCKRLRAIKDGYSLWVLAGQSSSWNKQADATASVTAAPGSMSLAAYVGIE